MKPEISAYPLYSYVSTRAGCDPCRTIYLCAPEPDCRTVQSLEIFARESGWQEIAEQEGAVLVAPAAPQGWDAQPTTVLREIYQQTRNRFATRSGEAIWGRMGSLWCWETMLYAVGYGEGAQFVGRTLVDCPNVLAAGAMVGGWPSDFRGGDLPSSHWLVGKVSPDYCVKNREIPVKAWFYVDHAVQAEQAAAYFRSCGGSVQVREGSFRAEPCLSWEIMNQCFARTIRWKNSPDGTLTETGSRADFYNSPRFLRRSAKWMGTTYGYSVHLPEGLSPAQIQGLPVVFTVHGRGEPAWLFTEKNGWDLLADETKEFVLVSPDSPGNIWFAPRDAQIFPLIANAVQKEFGTDPERVYLTGFSNGGMITREVGLRYPEVFAGISVWNAPKGDTFSMMQEDSGALAGEPGEALQGWINAFKDGCWELPCAFFYGDQDGAAQPGENYLMPLFLESNHCSATRDGNNLVGWKPDEVWNGENHYTPEAGYREGERFTTYGYRSTRGDLAVTVTMMKNMPHGAIREQSRAVWQFLRHYRREKGSPDVIWSEKE